jgi:hypothetical protein
MLKCTTLCSLFFFFSFFLIGSVGDGTLQQSYIPTVQHTNSASIIIYCSNLEQKLRAQKKGAEAPLRLVTTVRYNQNPQATSTHALSTSSSASLNGGGIKILPA